MQRVKSRAGEKRDGYYAGKDDKWMGIKRENGRMRGEIDRLRQELDKVKRGNKKTAPTNNEYMYE